MPCILLWNATLNAPISNIIGLVQVICKVCTYKDNTFAELIGTIVCCLFEITPKYPDNVDDVPRFSYFNE